MKQKLWYYLTKLTPTLALRDTKTVHFVFSFLFLLAVAVGIAGVSSSESAEIILETKNTTVYAGEIFQVEVYAVAKSPVNAVTLKINIPENMVEVQGIDKGESVITLWTADPKVENGVVMLEGGTYRKGFIGKHLIATLNVKAKQTGKATFVTASATLLAGDGKGTVVATDIKSEGQTELTIAKLADTTSDGEGSLEAEVAFVIVTDIDGDGEVTFSDITDFMAGWAKRSSIYDFNNDGDMSFKDFSILLADYFTG